MSYITTLRLNTYSYPLSLLMSYTSKSFPTEYTPTIFDKYVCTYQLAIGAYFIINHFNFILQAQLQYSNNSRRKALQSWVVGYSW